MDRTASVDSQSNEKSYTNKSKLKCYQKPGLVFTYIIVANFLQFMHMQFLSSSMLGLEKDMGYSPKKLSVLFVAEQVAFLIFVSIWGILCDLFELKYILIASIASSGCLVMVLSFIREFFSMVIFRMLNGIMIGSGIPAGQKYVVIANMKDAGRSFGIIHGVCALGKLTSSVIVTYFSSNKYFGVYGWRYCSFFLGITCIASIPLLLLIPNLKPQNRRLYYTIDLGGSKNILSVVCTIWKRFLAIASIKTILILSLINFFGDGFYSSAYFLTIYFQSCGLSNLKSGIAFSFAVLGGITSGILGGIATDFLHKKSPKYGRISMGVASACLRIIFTTWIIYGFTFDNILKRYTILVISLFLVGTTTASISVVDRSLFLDVVMPSEQSFGLGIMVTVCGATSRAIFPPIMGYLVKDVFGYQESVLDIKEMPYHVLRKNAFALRNSIASVTIFSSFSTLLFYLCTFSTYYKDSRAVQEKLELELSLTKVEVVPGLAHKRTLSRQDSL